MQQAATEQEVTSTRTASRRYAQGVNPRWVELLDLLGLNTGYGRCRGSELETTDGRTILDFLSGYCVYNTGHNHPAIIAELHEELDRLGPTMLQSHVPEPASELALRLLELAGGRLGKVYFTSSGSEGVDTAMKFARTFTGRDGILYCDGSFHGLTLSTLSVMGNPWWREGFGPFLPDCDPVPFGDLEALSERLATDRYAAFLVEPVQAEAGIVLPPEGYLQAAQDLCRRHGTLFVLDEVQTGLHRTGPFLAAHHWGLEPDMVVIAKALSGGLVPVGATLMTNAVYRKVYSSLSRAFIHASTYGENSMAMRAGLATLRVMERERLGDRAEALGKRIRTDLLQALGPYEMVGEVRGIGMLNGIVFRAPKRTSMRLPFAAFARIHSGMFGQMVVSQLFREEGILTQTCGNNHMVLKVAPPLTVAEHHLTEFVTAMDRILRKAHGGLSFWKGSLDLVGRAFTKI